jgi:tetratricopeptide (TPR) repeat protein
MSPRTNDSAPESGHGDRPQAVPTGPALRAAETGPKGSTTGAGTAGERTGAAAQPPADDARTGEGHIMEGQPEPAGTATAPETTGQGAGLTAPAPETTQTPTGPATPARSAPSPKAIGQDADPTAPATETTGTPTEPATSARPVPGPEVTGEGAGAGSDQRVVALRRFSASGRRWRAAQLGLCAASLAVALTAGAVVVGAVRDGGGAAPVASSPGGISPELLASGDLDPSIRALQAHLRAQPRDHGSWATLGLAYVEQARTKGDPSRYPQAQRALDRSLRLRPDNDAALAGRAALAAARHDFTGALTYADLALKQNPYSERALSSRIDALVELGRYTEAAKAADLADSRRPGVPVFTRYAYVHELRGDVKTARRVLEQALGTATTRGDIAYVATALGQLAWNQGDYKTALDQYARALAADDSYLPALEGRARAQAAQGDTADAIRAMEQVVDRYPLPQPLVELGELYEVRGKEGDPAKARDQYALVDAWVALARANGVDADLDTALAAADHGDRKAALKAARDEWARRHTVHTADALAWALHVNGRDQEALPYARRATATGYRNAAFLYHRGMIERATGHRDQARASLTAALRLNAGFSPLGAREARKALEAMK